MYDSKGYMAHDKGTFYHRGEGHLPICFPPLASTISESVGVNEKAVYLVGLPTPYSCGPECLQHGRFC